MDSKTGNRLVIAIIVLIMALGIAVFSFMQEHAPDNSVETMQSAFEEASDNSNNIIVESPDSNTGAELVYNHWHDMMEEWELPYADEATVDIIMEAYTEIDFFGEFSKGNLELYDEYKVAFGKLIRNEVTFLNKETDERMYIKDFGGFEGDTDVRECAYYFF